jgi:hypothetical protein
MVSAANCTNPRMCPNVTQPLNRHHDNDWYRQFLDSSGNALTIIHCFTDIPPRGGGTWLCEDGLAGSAQKMLDHPEGFDPPAHDKVLYTHIKDCKKFAQVSRFYGWVLWDVAECNSTGRG